MNSTEGTLRQGSVLSKAASLLSSRRALCVCLGATGLWLGMPNTVVQMPLLVLLYPAMLYLVGMESKTRAEAFRCAWLMGLAGASACLYWVSVPVHNVAGLPWFFAALVSVLLGSYVGLYGALFALLAHEGRTLPVSLRCLLAGIAWAVLEWVSSLVGGGFSWLVLALAFVPWPVVIQPVAYIGTFGLGGLLAGLACCGAESFRSTPCKPLRPLLASCLVFAMICGGGWLAVHTNQRTIAKALQNNPVRVALVQGNIDQMQKWDTAYRRSTLESYLSLSEFTGLDRVDLLIWPETAMPFDIQRTADKALFQRFVEKEGMVLLTGAPGYERSLSGVELFNRAYVFQPAAADAFYEKEHLVLFGEYVPTWLRWPVFESLLQGLGDFTPGRHSKPLQVMAPGRGLEEKDQTRQQLALGVLICYESIFPGLARQRVADGADLFVNISNDAWFGNTAGPVQHVYHAVLRSVEMGRFTARGANTGISAIISPLGVLVEQTQLNKATSLVGLVAPLSAYTVFFFLEPWLMPLVSVFFIGLELYCLRVRTFYPKR